MLEDTHVKLVASKDTVKYFFIFLYVPLFVNTL